MGDRPGDAVRGDVRSGDSVRGDADGDGDGTALRSLVVKCSDDEVLSTLSVF